jgi:hypothetical protein
MPQKLTKTRAELESLLIAELRTCPERSNVDAVGWPFCSVSNAKLDHFRDLADDLHLQPIFGRPD